MSLMLTKFGIPCAAKVGGSGGVVGAASCACAASADTVTSRPAPPRAFRCLCNAPSLDCVGRGDWPPARSVTLQHFISCSGRGFFPDYGFPQLMADGAFRQETALRGDCPSFCLACSARTTSIGAHFAPRCTLPVARLDGLAAQALSARRRWRRHTGVATPPARPASHRPSATPPRACRSRRPADRAGPRA